jgi:hypothetical protein
MNRNVFALFGVVAVLLTATVALTVSRATLSAGVGSLKCYNKSGIEKSVLKVWRRVCRRSMCERVQAVSDEARKCQYQWRRTAKYEKNLGCDAKHRPPIGDIR